MRTPAELLDKLLEQCTFLARSLEYFMHGDMSETLRLATSIRVLVHQTPRSASLLGQVKSDYQDLEIRDRRPPQPIDDVVMYYGGEIKFNTQTGKVMPHIDDTVPSLQMVRLGEWWHNVGIVVMGNRITHPIFTRKDLILTLANQEGGAHVDTELKMDYAELIKKSPFGIVVQGRSVPLPNLARCFVGESAARLLGCLQKAFHLPSSLAEVRTPPLTPNWVYVDSPTIQRSAGDTHP